jgi:hypothetical protein
MALSALWKLKSQHGTAQRLDQGANLRQLAATGVPLGKCRLHTVISKGLRVVVMVIRYNWVTTCIQLLTYIPSVLSD